MPYCFGCLRNVPDDEIISQGRIHRFAPKVGHYVQTGMPVVIPDEPNGRFSGKIDIIEAPGSTAHFSGREGNYGRSKPK